MEENKFYLGNCIYNVCVDFFLFKNILLLWLGFLNEFILNFFVMRVRRLYFIGCESDFSMEVILVEGLFFGYFVKIERIGFVKFVLGLCVFIIVLGFWLEVVFK